MQVGQEGVDILPTFLVMRTGNKFFVCDLVVLSSKSDSKVII